MHKKILPKPLLFLWDSANEDKNTVKHRVSTQEAEEVFIDPLLHIIEDTLHSFKETRWIVLGHTKAGRILSSAFTIRDNCVRVISARDASKKERKWYEEKISASKI